MLITERFWNPECYDSTQETITPGIEECGYNIMSADSFQNPCFATNSYRAFTVKIEKCDRPERIWVESKDSSRSCRRCRTSLSPRRCSKWRRDCS